MPIFLHLVFLETYLCPPRKNNIPPLCFKFFIRFPKKTYRPSVIKITQKASTTYKNTQGYLALLFFYLSSFVSDIQNFWPNFYLTLFLPPIFNNFQLRVKKSQRQLVYLSQTIRTKKNTTYQHNNLPFFVQEKSLKRPHYINDVDLITRPRYYTYVFIFYYKGDPFCLMLCLVVFTKRNHNVSSWKFKKNM